MWLWPVTGAWSTTTSFGSETSPTAEERDHPHAQSTEFLGHSLPAPTEGSNDPRCWPRTNALSQKRILAMLEANRIASLEEASAMSHEALRDKGLGLLLPASGAGVEEAPAMSHETIRDKGLGLLLPVSGAGSDSTAAPPVNQTDEAVMSSKTERSTTTSSTSSGKSLDGEPLWPVTADSSDSKILPKKADNSHLANKSDTDRKGPVVNLKYFKMMPREAPGLFRRRKDASDVISSL